MCLSSLLSILQHARPPFPAREQASFLSAKETRYETEEGKITLLDVLAKPVLLGGIVDGTDGNRKLLQVDVGMHDTVDILGPIVVHQGLVVVAADGLANHGRVETFLHLELGHVVVLLAHDPALGRGAGAEGKESGKDD